MEAGALTEHPESQGERFEKTFAELLERLIRDDLKLNLVDLSRQPRGRQGGKDLQVKWRNEAGRERFWHFECKSNREGVIATKEIADKLLQEAMAPHDLDVWCLAASDAEPSGEIDDVLNAAPQSFALDFALTVLSPSKGQIKWLYSCHPDLYQEQYGSAAMTMTKKERARRIEGFAEWLESWSEKRPRGGPQGWTNLTVRGIGTPPDSMREARAYLGGLTSTCPWAAVIHDWSVPRNETETRLQSRLDEMEPGLDYEWLISAAGEGKSTVLRRFAWQALRSERPPRVLWADEFAPASIPVEWLERLASGSRLLMCVDGSGQLADLGHALAVSERLAERDVRVFVLLADRGNLWKVHRARQRIPGRLRKRPLKLKPLTEEERGQLLERLEARGLVLESGRDRASKKLATAAARAEADLERDRWENSWLVPTVLEVVDPAERPFERILVSALEELSDNEQDDALRLLLAIALLHAAGPALPHDIAERLMGSEAALLAATDTLDQELERRFDATTSLSGGPGSRYLTHGAAVSDGFVRGAASEEHLRSVLETVCRRLPATMGPEYSVKTALRADRFELLDMSATYLLDVRREPQLAVALLEAWVELDALAFVALHRLGNAYLRWFEQGLKKAGFPPADLGRLATRGKESFRDALLVAEEVLQGRDVPAPYAQYDLGRTKRFTYNSWGALEGALGAQEKAGLGDRTNFVRATFLAVLSLGVKGNDAIVSSGLLARSLISLREYRLAAPVLAFLDSQPDKRRKLTSGLRKRLKAKKVKIPDGGVELLPEALESITREVFLPNRAILEVKPTEAENQALLTETLRRISGELPGGLQISIED